MSSLDELDPETELPLVPGLGELSAEAIADLATLVVQRRIGANELVTQQGHVPLGLLVLVRGAAKVVRHVGSAQKGDARVLDVARAPCLVPDASVLDGMPSDVSVVALRASLFFVVERRGLLKAMTAHPSLARAVLARFARLSRTYTRRFDELATGTVEERLHRLLEGLAAHHGSPLDRGRFIALPLLRRDLASMINATTETVSRLLAKLEREGQARSTRGGLWWRGRGKGAPLAESDPPASSGQRTS